MKKQRMLFNSCLPAAAFGVRGGEGHDCHVDCAVVVLLLCLACIGVER